MTKNPPPKVLKFQAFELAKKASAKRLGPRKKIIEQMKTKASGDGYSEFNHDPSSLEIGDRPDDFIEDDITNQLNWNFPDKPKPKPKMRRAVPVGRRRRLHARLASYIASNSLAENLHTMVTNHGYNHLDHKMEWRRYKHPSGHVLATEPQSGRWLHKDSSGNIAKGVGFRDLRKHLALHN